MLGLFRVTEEDILSGAKFPDAICTVRFGVDVHKLHRDDVLENSRGRKITPYHLPFRSQIPADCRNLLLAGRCISGDFYPHTSYRVMGDMLATGEAAGYAAACCLKEKSARRSLTEKGYPGL